MSTKASRGKNAKKRSQPSTATQRNRPRPAGGSDARPADEPTRTPEAGDALNAFRPPSIPAPGTGQRLQGLSAGRSGTAAVGRSNVAGQPSAAPRTPSGAGAVGRSPAGATVPAGASRRPAAPSRTTDEVTPLPAAPTSPAPQARAAGAPFLASDMPADAVQVMSWNCSSLEGVEPQGLGLTYWFDAAPAGEPYPVSVEFTGRRVSGDASTGQQTFTTVRTLDRVVPGSGRIALTSRVSDVAPGEWQVTARPVVPRRPDGRPGTPPPGRLPTGTSVGTTAFLPVARVRAPGVRVGAWPALVGFGWILALVLQWFLGAQRDLPVGRQAVVSLIASGVGLAGAKIYYLVTHPAEKGAGFRAGMSVQGFVIGSVAVLLLGGWLAGIPIGPMLDVTAPGLLVGLTIGRLGCFFGGCCVGLPTASRWGIWSSDRTVGVRRIPVQLFESATAGVVAVFTTLAVVLTDPAVGGLLFLAGFSAYTLGRQLLFPLRGIARASVHGRQITMLIAGLVLAGSLLVLMLA